MAMARPLSGNVFSPDQENDDVVLAAANEQVNDMKIASGHKEIFGVVLSQDIRGDRFPLSLLIELPSAYARVVWASPVRMAKASSLVS